MKVLALGLAWGLVFAAGVPALAAEPALPRDLGLCAAEQAKLAPFNGVIAAGMGSVRFESAVGFADAGGQVPLARSTPFRLASVGKLFTQVAIGLLADAGKLKLDDPVRRHLPELPASFEAITIAQLLQHRAGVAPMTRPALADAPVMAAATRARELVPLIAAKPLSFEPGSQTQYSNGGYLLLGAVIEAASGQPYREFVTQQIFVPLGMKSSGFEPGAAAAVPMTRLTGPGQPPAAQPQPRIEFAALKASSAGDALSSAADMEIFAGALLGDRFLTVATKAALFPVRAQTWRAGQAGGSAGSNTGFWVFLDRGAWLVVLSNFDPPAGEWMGKALSAVLAGEPCQPTAPQALSPPRHRADISRP